MLDAFAGFHENEQSGLMDSVPSTRPNLRPCPYTAYRIVTGSAVYFPNAIGKDSSEVGKMGMFEGMKKPRAGELQGA